MATDQDRIDFESDENLVLLNPRWPDKDAKTLRSLAIGATEDFDLRGHIWVTTSGSTADSLSSTKLVALSKFAILASARAVNQHLLSTTQDIWTQVLPIFHVGGLGIEARAYLSGAKVVNALKNDRWDADHFHQVLLKEKCTLSALVPTQVYDLVAKKLKSPGTLRAVVVGGGALDPDLYAKARQLGWPLLPSYGMTETCSQVATAQLRTLESMDYPEMILLPHAKARRNQQGFLEFRGDSLLTCYAQDGHQPPIWDPKKSDWFTTEDQGEVQGPYVKILGRSKDYIKIGGEGTNISRLRIILEKIVSEKNLDEVQKVTLIDIPSERLGHEVHMVSAAEERLTERWRLLFDAEVLPFERVRQIRYVREIPRSDLGKILWAELRKKL